MVDFVYRLVPKWCAALLLCTLSMGIATAHAEAPKLLDDIIDPLLGNEGEDEVNEGENDVIDDIIDPILGGEGEGEAIEGEDDGGLLDDIIDPVLGGEGEGEGDEGLIDEIIDPVLGGEGEEDGGLLDDIFDPVLGVLPDPIVGLDPFEPDNNPKQARWSGLVNAELIRDVSDLTGLLRTHNFHVAGDEDWVRFYAQEGQEVRIETRDLLSSADTFLSVYRVLRANETIDNTPAECIDKFVEGPLGTTLAPVGCNDDAGGSDDTRRSLVQFVAPATGFYYSQVRFSPNVQVGGGSKSNGSSGPETTYNYAGSYSGTFSSTLFCTVLADEDDQPITDAMVHLDPNSIAQSYNQDGVYPIDSLPSGTYTATVTAPGRDARQTVVNIGSGEMKDVTVRLQSDVPPFVDEGGGVGSEGELEEEPNEPVEEEAPVEEEEPTEEEAPVDEEATERFHASDYMAPHGHLSLDELLRAVQYYNARAYHCADATEDGYAPYPGDRKCEPHEADFAPMDWSISLTELLRLVQLYNVGAFESCGETDDGVCPKVS